MHNRRGCLNTLDKLIVKEGATGSTIIEKENIGVRLTGESKSIMFHKGTLLGAYNKALAAVVKGEWKPKKLINVIEADPLLIFLNMKERGIYMHSSLSLHCQS